MTDANDAPQRWQVGTDEDPVTRLAMALRRAESAHRAYVAELCLGDVEPAEDWSTWYAEYLLGER
ncbi:MAG TPA: hypothetical protein VHC67_03215 [Gaiellaceae bacterium]|jgi:hypothetical protein|nr:hypothetical protein [Gaiellaceae bacterium]